MESLLFLHDVLGKLPHGVQRGKVQQTQMDIRVSCFLPDLFDCCRPTQLTPAGQDDTGPTLGKVQGNEFPNT